MACAVRGQGPESHFANGAPLTHNKMRQPLPVLAEDAMFPLLPPEPRFAWDPVETRTADDAIEDLLLVLARAGLTPLAVHCVQTFEGPFRLSQALRLVFGLAVSVREEQWKPGASKWLPSSIARRSRQSLPGLPRGNVVKSVNKVSPFASCQEEETAYAGYAGYADSDSLFELDRWVDRNFNSSRHGFLARGKGEVFSEDCRSFTKKQRGHRLSLVSENQVHLQGSERYIIAFTAGELSRADGVGIIFSLRLPRSSDIQKIISVFLNRTGRICSRINQRVTRIASSLPQIEVGDILEVVNNLDMNSLKFTVWTKAGHEFTASISYSEVAIAMGFEGRPVPGHLAVVVKNPGVSVSLFS